jgi:hypothetical protein
LLEDEQRKLTAALTTEWEMKLVERELEWKDAQKRSV